ncbi:MAG: hypothetical protein WDN08_08595 [Rhizomicrobium sp.]
MRRAVGIAAAALLLAGCDSIGELTSDAFDPRGATQSRFTLDSADCAAAAGVRIDTDIRGIAGTHVERHEMFNRIYTDCMRRSGYVRRDWSPDIAIPYTIDPTP